MLLTSTRADEDTIVPALIVWVNVLSVPVASQIFASSTVTETGTVRLLVSNSTRLRSTWPHGRLASAKCTESGLLKYFWTKRYRVDTDDADDEDGHSKCNLKQAV